MHRYLTPLPGSSQTVPGTHASLGTGPAAATTAVGAPRRTRATAPTRSTRTPIIEDPPSPGARGGIAVEGEETRCRPLARAHLPMHGDSAAACGDDRERQRDTSPLFWSQVAVASPP